MKDRPDTPGELKARALRHLARREHARAELARKLAPHAETGEMLEALLDALEAGKQLSDARYAESRARQLARKYGVAKIRQDLKAKGVDGGLLAVVSADDELQRARTILERKYRAPAATRAERARRMRFLQSRGFSMEVIVHAVGRSSDLEA